MRTFIEQAGPHDGPLTGSVTLACDERRKSRQRVRLDDGSDAGLLLPWGTFLRGGARLRADDGTIIEVRAAAESLSSATAPDPLTLTRAAYHLGNRHVPLQVGPDFLRYQHDHVLDDMVLGLGLSVTALHAPFEPEAGAFSGGDRHTHAAGHDHAGHGHHHHHHDTKGEG